MSRIECVPEEGELERLIRSGTSDQVARAFHPHVRRIVLRTLSGDCDPDIVVTATTDALLAVCRYRSSFRNEAKVLTWIHVIARRAARKCARREHARTCRIRLVDPATLAEWTAERALVRPQARQSVEAREALAALIPNESWRRIWLLANDPDLCLSRAEVARLTGYTTASVGVILSRVRGRLNDVHPKDIPGLS